MAHILIVDDSPTDVKVLSGMLERAGHRVSSAASAESSSPRMRLLLITSSASSGSASSAPLTGSTPLSSLTM